MDINLRLFRYFLAVAETMNISRASEQLHTAQPSLSMQIRQLEDAMGIRLFVRDKNRLQLTNAGRELVPLAKSILGSVDHATAVVQEAARAEGRVLVLGSVSGPEKRIFLRFLPLILQYHPDLTIYIKSLNGPEQIDALLRQEIDAGIFRDSYENSELASELILRERVVFVLPASCEFAAKDHIDAADVAKLADKMRFITASGTSAPGLRALGQRVQECCGVSFREGLCVESILTGLNAVAAGFGFAILTEYAEELAFKGVSVRPLALETPIFSDVRFVYRRDNHIPALATAASVARCLSSCPGYESCPRNPRQSYPLGEPKRSTANT